MGKMVEQWKARFRLWRTGTNGGTTVDEKPTPDNLTNTCKQCGEVVESLGRQPKLFCGPKCYQRWKRSRSPKHLRPAIQCVECGDSFVPIRDDHKRCSKVCRTLYHVRCIKQKRTEMQKYNLPVRERKPCEHCGQLFSPEDHTNALQRMYCSHKCKHAAEFRPAKTRVLLEQKRAINKYDLATTAHATEIAEYRAAGGQISVYPGLPDPRVANINVGMKAGKAGAEWSAKDIADLDEYEDVINLTNTF